MIIIINFFITPPSLFISTFLLKKNPRNMNALRIILITDTPTTERSSTLKQLFNYNYH